MYSLHPIYIDNIYTVSGNTLTPGPPERSHPPAGWEMARRGGIARTGRSRAVGNYPEAPGTGRAEEEKKFS